MSEIKLSGIKQQWYVFDGQNATTGTPNDRTGRMSYWGDLHAFSSKKKALDYVDAHDDNFQGQICAAGGRQTMRKYCLGLSLDHFDLYLKDQVSFRLDEAE